jgi:hypothetical protein
MMRATFARYVGGTCAVLISVAANGVQAAPDQSYTELDPRLKPAMHAFESPEHFILELRGGPYTPNVVDTVAGDIFGGDKGPNFAAQLDGILRRIPGLYYITLGGSIGTVSFSGPAQSALDGTSVGEKTTLSIIPVQATAGIRFDVLPRKLHVPIIFGARAGWEWAHWTTGTGARDDASGWSVGPVVSLQVALDLDSFEPNGARSLDEEWGINHTYVFGEVFHFEPLGKSLPIGATSWLLGVGFIF